MVLPMNNSSLQISAQANNTLTIDPPAIDPYAIDIGVGIPPTTRAITRFSLFLIVY